MSSYFMNWDSDAWPASLSFNPASIVTDLQRVQQLFPAGGVWQGIDEFMRYVLDAAC